MKILNLVALILMIIGAINWGLWAFFQVDLVSWISNGSSTFLGKLIYALVGLAGVWGIGFISKWSGHCNCNRRKMD